MADEDLIFRLEGVDCGQTSQAGHDGHANADSDDEDGYFICSITDDPSSDQNANAKVNNYYSNLMKCERYGSSGSPAGSFHFKGRRRPGRVPVCDWPVFSDLDNMAHGDHDHPDNHRDSENSGDSGYPSEKRGELDDLDPREHGYSNGHRRYESDDDSLGSSGRVCVEKWNLVNSSRRHLPRASAVALEVQRLNALDLEKKIGKSILGKVHLAMVRYHEGGRFCEKDEEWDRESAIFHLEHAADLGELEAIVGLGLMYSQLPHHILASISLKETEENKTKGFDYLLKAAEAGDRQSMILVARAFDSGWNLGPDRSPDWSEALRWYSTALKTTDCDEGGEYHGMQDEPRYTLLAREAEMLLKGGCGLEKDPRRSGDLYTEAAEAAMEAMKGRLANQYYEKAEEAWAQMEE
ncbi:PREDICTED: eukaryotic elongation factor 2 kinase [Elephantulus edwardii]|uniref:eukaryotic elongation factor 2 kinase n=1 Tax=Elephantulus edwardii TaxID=28737 RepID=UPI0003F0C7FF|nr:PREDICTED: eukaryotic elongation factor 2 kinase [Elephantulus edwardii]